MVELGFSRDKKLLNREQFQQVFDQPQQRFGNRGLLLLARQNTTHGPRLGLVISKKNARLAIQRNRIKRQVREVFRLKQTELNGWDIVVLSRAGVSQLPSADLRQTVEHAFNGLVRRLNPLP